MKEENLAGFLNTATNREKKAVDWLEDPDTRDIFEITKKLRKPAIREKKEPYTERLYDLLAPIPLDVYRKEMEKEMEHDFDIEHQCPGCGKWLKGDDSFCGTECFNNYIDRQYLIKQAEQKDKTMKLMGGRK
jgi:hypothetical protein